jgi:hypothetical protein
MFVLLASLTQDQRNTLTSIMTHRGRTLCQYNVTELKDLFPEMLCAAKTGAGNSISAVGQKRFLLILEEECDL